MIIITRGNNDNLGGGGELEKKRIEEKNQQLLKLGPWIGAHVKCLLSVFWRRLRFHPASHHVSLCESREMRAKAAAQSAHTHTHTLIFWSAVPKMCPRPRDSSATSILFLTIFQILAFFFFFSFFFVGIVSLRQSGNKLPAGNQEEDETRSVPSHVGKRRANVHVGRGVS